MNSKFAQIFLAIQNRLATLVASGIGTGVIGITFVVGTQNPLIRHIDHNIGQLRTKLRPAVDYPFVFIDFEGWKFEDMGVNAQTAEGNVIITLGFTPYDNTSEDVPEVYKELALGYYDIETAINIALHGWSPDVDDVGSLTRIAATPDNQRPDIRIRKITYKLAFEDYSTEDQYTTAPATPDITTI